MVFRHGFQTLVNAFARILARWGLKALRWNTDSAVQRELERLSIDLATERKLFNKVLEQLPVAVGIGRPESGELILTNKALREIIQGDWRAVRVSDYNTFYEGYFEDGRRIENEDWPLARAIRGETVTNEIIRLRRGEGGFAYTRQSAAPVYDDDGRLLAGVVTFSNITEERAIQEKIRNLLKAEADAKETLSLAISAAKIGTYNWDVINDQHVWSKETERLFGFQEGEFPRTTPAFMSRIHPDDREKIRTTVQNIFAEKRSVHETSYRIIHPDGSIMWAEVRGTAFYDESGRPIRILGVIIDATLKHEVENYLRVSKAQAEAASEAKSRFLANMSHEIRTPLGIILGTLDLLGEHRKDEAEFERIVLMARRNAKQLSQLINDVLDLSKIEAGVVTVEETKFNLNELLEDLAMSLNVKAQEKGIHLILRSDGPVPERVQSDPLRLRQILTNVIGNAIKFTDKGYVRVTVRAVFSATLGNRCKLEFEVEDTGIGMTEDQASRLFQPFVQADNSVTRKFGGTGLGLALSRKLAQTLGGEVEVVRAEYKKGCTFRVTILNGDIRETQFETILDQELKSDAPIKVGNLLATPLSGLNVLLVDDSPDNRFMVSRFLKAAGAKVETAQDGLEGLTKALQGEYSVVLMDVQMPTMDGETATRTLKARGYGKPIIALTAHAMSHDRERGMKIGFDDYLTKPIDRSALIRRLSELVHADVDYA